MNNSIAIEEIKRWIESDTRINMTMAQRGMFLDLLLHRHVFGSLPADEDELEFICCCGTKQFQELWPSISKFFALGKGEKLYPAEQL